MQINLEDINIVSNIIIKTLQNNNDTFYLDDRFYESKDNWSYLYKYEQNTIIGYKIKEEFIFDKRNMISHYLVLGIAPIGYNKQSKDSSRLFWIYYPGFRKTLAQSHIVSERVSQIENMDDVIYFRDYSGALYKPTNNNPYNVDFKNYPNMYKKTFLKWLWKKI